MRLSAQTFPFTKDKLVGVNVSMSVETLKNRRVVRVTKDSVVKEVDEPTFVRLNGVAFKDGVIEVMVLSKLQANAPELARGFIGVAFRINEDHSKFECIYIRPANGRDSNQVRRNHSIQYFSYPDYKFSRLRKEAPEQYESYADMGLNEWIKLKIVVKGQQARLFINGSKEPALIVNDLKHGAGHSGAIGLWVDVGTEGFFSDLKILR
ncbi:hypothetical protein SAMN04488109_2041 [Chryseolinea serpens]|uniref:3-keto-disaccharide hydrolase domain-containing protein n=2 Tax=Chryseolinea serpens TaxID=947013 RepID=A0A1M5N276_9BACT|nr:hypothetical protein SAMN04488109_2041 [Chryseolinea serpens]